MPDQLYAPLWADTRLLQAYLDALPTRVRRKVFVILNGKGGVGKSSLASSLAVNLSLIGKRCLLVEMDPQGNNAQDLGFERDKSLFDNGLSQTEAIFRGGPLTPTGEVRKRLWVVPGGGELGGVITELHCQMRYAQVNQDVSWVAMYAAAIEKIADDFDSIILDVAPGDEAMQLQAMVAGDMVIIPCRSDISSRKGLRTVAARFGEGRQYNPNLSLLGVVLFGINSSATTVRNEIAKMLERDIGGYARVFDTSIRYVEAAATECRVRGMVAQELAAMPNLGTSLKNSLRQLAGDYRSLGTEVMTAASQLIDQDADTHLTERASG